MRVHVANPLAIVVIVASLAIGGSYYYQVHQEQTRASCQAKYNKAFSSSLSQRSDASNARTDALDAVVGGFGKLVLSPAKTAADQAKAAKKTQQLFKDYAEAVKQNNMTKAANPLPDIPNC